MTGVGVWIVVAVAIGCGLAACADDSSSGGVLAGGGGAPTNTAGAAAPGLAELGRTCQPTAVPEGGFAQQEAYIEQNSAACGDGVCLVFRVTGDPSPECRQQPDACDANDPACRGTARCADPAQVREHVHCSCRCGGPAGQGPFCECNDGFICVPTLDQGSPDVVGRPAWAWLDSRSSFATTCRPSP